MVAIEAQRHRTVGKAPRQRMDTIRLLMWPALLPAIIDYKPKGAQDWTAILYSILVLISIASCFIIAGQYPNRKFKNATFAGFVSLIFALVAYSSGVFWGQEQVALVRSMSPILLFSVGIFLAGSLASSGIPLSKIVDDILKVAAIGLVINLILVAAINGIDFDTVRYQVLTAGAPLVCAHMVSLLLFGGWRPWNTLSSLLYASLVLISVTRTQLAIIGALSLFGLAFASVKIARSKALPLQFVALLAIVASVFLADAVLPTSPLARWEQRIFSADQHHGLDITTVTRVGETGYQIDKLKESVPGLMFGFGASAQNFYDGENARIIAILLGTKAAYWTETGVGHNNYVGTIYVGGIVAGGALLLMQAFALVKASYIFRRMSAKDGAWISSTIAAAPFGVVAFMTYGFLGGTMGGRSGCLLFGLSIGLTLCIAEMVKARRNAP